MALPNFKIKARLILYDKGKILLLRQTKPKGGNYTLVGGTVERMETAIECLIRESEEEAGVIISANQLELVHVMEKISKYEQRYVLYYKANEWKGFPYSKEPKKFIAAQWHSLENLPYNLTLTVKTALREYRKGNMYSVIDKR